MVSRTSSWQSIPQFIPRALHRYPVLLSGAIGAANGLRRLVTLRRRVLTILAIASIATVAGVFLAFVLRERSVGLAIQWLLDHRGLVVAGCCLYVASLIARRYRDLELADRRSWLVATPVAQPYRRITTAARVFLSLIWRIVVVAGVLTGLVTLNAAVTMVQALHLSGLIAAGALAGVLPGWWLSRRAARAPRERSSYVPRLAPAAQDLVPSAAALSRWPIVQALAWSRPANARLILAAAILSVPGGTGALGAACILVMWFSVSYLVALLRAVPRVARSAAEWLCSTPMSFWAFAWPIAWRALFHQLCGTLIATAVLVVLGSPPVTALYVGSLWLTMTLLTNGLALADCYRGRSPVVKITLAIATTLLAEQRGFGWGISFALLLGAWHLRIGATHEGA